MRALVIEEQSMVGYEGCYALIVPDHASGRVDQRYSVYLIPSSPSRPTIVIGRELSLDSARNIAGKAAYPENYPGKEEF